MKLHKAKRFNTIESYASCACIETTCSCSCNSCSCPPDIAFQSGREATDIRTGQVAYEKNHYDAHAVYFRN